MKLGTRLENPILLTLSALLTVLWLHLTLVWVTRMVAPQWLIPQHLLVTLFALTLGGAGVTHWVLQKKWPLARARLLVGGLGLSAIILLLWSSGNIVTEEWLAWLGHSVPLGVVSFILWLRGIALGRHPVGHHNFFEAFLSGVVALGVVFFLDSVLPRLTNADVVFPLLLFFALSLGGLAFTSLRRVRVLAGLNTNATIARLAFNRYWALTALATICFIVAGGLLTILVIAPDALEALRVVAGVIFGLLTVLLTLLIIPFLFIFEWLLTPLLPFLRELARRVMLALEEIFTRLSALVGGILAFFAQPLQQIMDASGLTEFIKSPLGQATGRAGIGIVIICIMAVVFWFAIRRFGRLTPTNNNEERDSVLTRDLLLAQLRRLFQRRPPKPAPPPPYLLLELAEDPRLVVRRAYQTLLAWANARFRPRTPGQTPTHYAELLGRAYPEWQARIAQLTALYHLARYSPTPPSAAQAQIAHGLAVELEAAMPGGKVSKKTE